MSSEGHQALAAPRITAEWLRRHCRTHNQYLTPALNETLHLHLQGFERLECLEEYTGLRSVFLEGNGLVSLRGLEAATGLRCIFASQNCLTAIEPHLTHFSELNTLDVSRNLLQSLEGVGQLGALTSLQAAGNQLRSLESLAALHGCALLSTLDLSENGLELDGPAGATALLELLGSLASLRVLYLSQGNPKCVAAFTTYRKSLLAALPGLTYLDDRPVFDSERRSVAAWSSGGAAAERAVEAAEAAACRNADAAGIAYMASLREERGMADEPGGDDGSASEMEDPPELRRAMALLATFPPVEGEEEPLMLTSTRAALQKAGRLGRMDSLEEAGREAWAAQAEMVAASLEEEQAAMDRKASDITAAIIPHPAGASPASRLAECAEAAERAEEPSLTEAAAPCTWRDFSQAGEGPDSDDDCGYASACEAFSPPRLILTELDC